MERSLCPTGVAHEGASALRSGMAPIPSVAEVLRVQRDLALAEYAGGGLHLMGISCAESVRLIREAKARGLDVTADVCIANLVGTDGDVEGYDTAYKLLPPLRSADDQAALWDGLRDGSIDVVVSDHHPMDHELKSCEWGSAHFGASTLDACFGWYNARSGAPEDLALWVEAAAHRPRALFGLGPVTVNVGSPADFTIFSLDELPAPSASIGVNRPKWPVRGTAVGIVLDTLAVPATARP